MPGARTWRRRRPAGAALRRGRPDRDRRPRRASSPCSSGSTPTAARAGAGGRQRHARRWPRRIRRSRSSAATAGTAPTSARWSGSTSASWSSATGGARAPAHGGGGRFGLDRLLDDGWWQGIADEALRQARLQARGGAGAGRRDDRGAGRRLARRHAARGGRPRARGRLQPQGHLGLRRPARPARGRARASRWSTTAPCPSGAARSPSTTRARPPAATC